MLSADFFDVEKFPEIEFKSTKVQRGKDRDSLDVEGTLTVKDKSVPIALAVNEMDRSRSPRGEEFVYYSATAELDRFAFGINYGRGLIGRHLKVTINVQASKLDEEIIMKLLKHSIKARILWLLASCVALLISSPLPGLQAQKSRDETHSITSWEHTERWSETSFRNARQGRVH